MADYIAFALAVLDESADEISSRSYCWTRYTADRSDGKRFAPPQASWPGSTETTAVSNT